LEENVMVGKKILKLGAVLVLTLGVAAPGVTTLVPSTSVQAAQTPTFNAQDLRDGTYEVPYTVKKQGTDQASLANSFFTGSATVVVTDQGQKETVTLHVQKFANMIKAFKIGDQEAQVTNATSTSADLTFAVTADFAKPTVTAAMNVLNMDQKADIEFATALFAAAPVSSKPDTSAIPDTSAVSTSTTDEPSTTPKQTTAAATTREVAYTVNKAGTATPSLANSFFTGSATVDAQQKTVTLHIQKFANMIKTFKIGTQEAKVTNATGATADLTFTLDASFNQATVTATMNVMNMNQTADIAFKEPLYQASDTTTAPNKPVTTPVDSTQPTQTNPTTDAQTDDTPKTTPITTPKAQTVTAGVYRADDGQLTQQASAAQAFIAKTATTSVSADGQTTTVTLHTTGAQYINAMSLLGQAGKMTHQDGNEADLVFDVPTAALKYALPATFQLTILGGVQMTQSAFVLIDLPIDHAEPYLTKGTTPTTSEQTATTPDKGQDTTPTESGQTGTTSASDQSTPSTTEQTDTTADNESTTTAQTGTTPTTSATDTYDVAYTINKAGSDQVSLANGFFTGSATVVTAGQTKTVTLHLQKFANMVKSFKIGEQAAKITNATASTADLTFTVDANFAKRTVTATMNVLNMNQTADIVFATALFTDSGTDQKPATDTDDTATQPATEPTTSTAGGDQVDQQPTTGAATSQQATIKVYQAEAGQLSQQPSAAQAFLADRATLVQKGQNTQITLHTTGAEYINAMQLLGQTGQVINRKGNEADLVFTVPTVALRYALPATFQLTVPGGVKMTQSAFVLVNLGIANARPYPTTTSQPTTADTKLQTPDKAAVRDHATATSAINPRLAVQYVPYTVWNQSRSALSTANNYFTHSAKVVKVANGFNVYLTVQETAGMVKFQPLAINNGRILAATQTQANGQDIWTFAFHIDQAGALNQLIPATIRMSVPIAGINGVTFAIWLEFNQTQIGGTNYEQATTATAALPAKTIPLVASSLSGAQSPTATALVGSPHIAAAKPVTKSVKPSATTPKATTTQRLASEAAHQKALPKVKSYPFLAEIGGFAGVSLAIIGLAFFKRWH
jgi:heme-binding NEAT domain protein